MGTEENKKSEPASPGASRLEDGGPAFPVECYEDHEGNLRGKQTGDYSYMHTGVSLRDYFAAKALQGLLTHQAFIPDHTKSREEILALIDAGAGIATLYADALLKARRTT